MKYIYLIGSVENGIYKIGYSKHPKKRLKQIQTGNDKNLSIIHIFESEYPTKVESAIHNRYNFRHKNGEWYELTYDEVKSFLTECQKIENNIKYLIESGNIFI